MRFIFFGTPEFAAIILEKLIAAGYAPAAVICNPDEPVGRKQILTPPPVKRLIANGRQLIEIFQPANKSELSAISHKLSAIKPDLAIVAAYGKIFPKEILKIPKHGFINVHGSLLPYYRGASPIQTAILNDEKETGVTIMEVDEEMDHGNIISNIKYQISKLDTYETLSKKLAILGAELLIKTIPDYISGKIKPVEQEHNKATYTKIIKKEDGKINWSKNAEEIERMVRAYYPWPNAWTTWNGKILKIIEADVLENKNNYQIGEIFVLQYPYKLENVGMLLGVECSKDVLIIKKLQLEGGKVLTTKEFLNGHKDFIGGVLK
jgi:methionyl-tRNA formyltransferase